MKKFERKNKKLEDLLTEELNSHKELKIITGELKAKIVEKDSAIKERNTAVAQLNRSLKEKEGEVEAPQERSLSSSRTFSLYRARYSVSQKMLRTRHTIKETCRKR